MSPNSAPVFWGYTSRQLRMMALLFLAFNVVEFVGDAIFGTFTIFQPAAGVALAFLVVEGIALWPAVLAGALFSFLLDGSGVVFSLFSAAGHTLHAVAAAWLLNLLAFDPVFRRVRDMFAFLLTTLVISSLIPLLGTLGDYLTPPFGAGTILSLFDAWWAAVFLGDLVVGALMIRWMAKPNFVRTRMEWAEIAIAFSVIITVSYVIFWTDAFLIGINLSFLLYIAPFIWFVLRLGMRFTLLAFTLTTCIALAGLLYGPESLPVVRDISRIVSVELFMATFAVIFYLFVAVVEERERASRDLNAQLDRVKTLLYKVRSEDRAKSEFLAIFSHELRNPLAPIVSSLELLKLRGVPDPETKGIIDIIDERVRVIVRLLDDLLDISRISRKTFKLKRERLELQSIVSQSVRSVRDIIEKRSLSLTLNMRTQPMYIYADPVRIEQILVNLLNNAAKYTNPGGSITISVGEYGAFASIRVKDTGIGIDPRMLDRIFQPFLQLEKDEKQRIEEGGLGIGLSLTEKLVVMHGGTIEAHSDGRGRGSEFVVSIPRADGGSTRAAKPARHLTTPLTVLVVDDNEAAGYVLGEMLHEQGHHVEYAMSGVEAIQRIVDNRPDAAVVDLGLPDMDGYTMARMLREDEHFEGILIAVAEAGEEKDRLRATSAGFDHVMVKPVNARQIESALGRSSFSHPA